MAIEVKRKKEAGASPFVRINRGLRKAPSGSQLLIRRWIPVGVKLAVGVIRYRPARGGGEFGWSPLISNMVGRE